MLFRAIQGIIALKSMWLPIHIVEHSKKNGGGVPFVICLWINRKGPTVTPSTYKTIQHAHRRSYKARSYRIARNFQGPKFFTNFANRRQIVKIKSLKNSMATYNSTWTLCNSWNPPPTAMDSKNILSWRGRMWEWIFFFWGGGWYQHMEKVRTLLGICLAISIRTSLQQN